MGLREWILLISLSLLQTDWYQSQPILSHTQTNPLTAPTGAMVWENNSTIAGDREAAERLVGFMAQAHEEMPLWASAALAVSRLITVSGNDAMLQDTDMPRCFIIAYRIRF